MAITAGQNYQFLFGTLAQYEALKVAGTISANDLYFITDTKQIYVGADLYTGQVQFVEAFPESPSQGIIYVNGSTHETKVWNGSAWQIMIPAISETLTEATEDTLLVNAKAIRDYVAGVNNEAVADVAYDAAAQKFTITYGDDSTSELLLKNLITGAAYDGATGNFTFTVANGEAVVINTPKENFLSAASFDEASHILTLTLDDGTTVEVDLKELVDTYTVKATATVELAMSESGEITANVKKSEAEGNALVLNEDGLFIPEALVKSIASTATVELAVSEAGELTANAKISAAEGNALSANEDGLFVAETDLSGYYTKGEADAELAKKADKATTLAGYGIADAYTKNEVDEAIAAVNVWKVIE